MGSLSMWMREREEDNLLLQLGYNNDGVKRNVIILLKKNTTNYNNICSDSQNMLRGRIQCNCSLRMVCGCKTTSDKDQLHL